MDHLDNNKIFCNIQHGFRAKISFESQVKTTAADISETSNRREQMEAIL